MLTSMPLHLERLTVVVIASMCPASVLRTKLSIAQMKCAHLYQFGKRRCLSWSDQIKTPFFTQQIFLKLSMDPASPGPTCCRTLTLLAQRVSPATWLQQLMATRNSTKSSRKKVRIFGLRLARKNGPEFPLRRKVWTTLGPVLRASDKKRRAVNCNQLASRIKTHSGKLTLRHPQLRLQPP